MSRRHSSRVRQQPLPWDDLQQPHWSQVSWWFEEIPGYEPYVWAEWQDAWADVTLRVTDAAWHRTGATLYTIQRDALLREDLQSWLAVQAQIVASKFIPNPWHPSPESHWGAFLSRALTNAAGWHFREVVGRHEEAQAAYNKGIASTDYLDEREATEGMRVQRRTLHGHDLMYLNPLDLIVRTENIVEEARNYLQAQQQSGTYSTASTNGVCSETRCGLPVHGRGLCKKHYQQHRYWWGNDTGQTCIEPGCQIPAYKRQRCGAHYKSNREKEVAAGTWQPTQPAEGCIEPGCEEPHSSKGRCQKHYDAHRRSKPTPPCEMPGCDKPSQTRKMCPMHYQQWRKEKRGAGVNEERGGGS